MDKKAEAVVGGHGMTIVMINRPAKLLRFIGVIHYTGFYQTVFVYQVVMDAASRRREPEVIGEYVFQRNVVGQSLGVPVKQYVRVLLCHIQPRLQVFLCKEVPSRGVDSNDPGILRDATVNEAGEGSPVLEAYASKQS